MSKQNHNLEIFKYNKGLNKQYIQFLYKYTDNNNCIQLIEPLKVNTQFIVDYPTETAETAETDNKKKSKKCINQLNTISNLIFTKEEYTEALKNIKHVTLKNDGNKEYGELTSDFIDGEEYHYLNMFDTRELKIAKKSSARDGIQDSIDNWKQFLINIFGNEENAEALDNYLATVINQEKNHRIAISLSGLKDSGKTLFFNILSEVMGSDYNENIIYKASGEITNRFFLFNSGLSKKKLILLNEATIKQEDSISRFKDLLDNKSSIQVESKGKDKQIAEPFIGLIGLTNEKQPTELLESMESKRFIFRDLRTVANKITQDKADLIYSEMQAIKYHYYTHTYKDYCYKEYELRNLINQVSSYKELKQHSIKEFAKQSIIEYAVEYIAERKTADLTQNYNKTHFFIDKIDFKRIKALFLSNLGMDTDTRLTELDNIFKNKLSFMQFLNSLAEQDIIYNLKFTNKQYNKCFYNCIKIQLDLLPQQDITNKQLDNHIKAQHKNNIMVSKIMMIDNINNSELDTNKKSVLISYLENIETKTEEERNIIIDLIKGQL